MNPLEPPIDRLARAEAALRDEPSPAGPSVDLIARTRAALRDADDHASHNPKPRRRPMIVMLKYAAAALLALATAGLPYLATAPRAGASPFAEAAEKLRDAHTLSYKLSFQLPGQDKPTTGREFFKDPGLVRTQMDAPNESIAVHDTVDREDLYGWWQGAIGELTLAAAAR